ncbi:MAG: recombinase RecA [Planctomycetales bacterium]|nr:recombinase RecA [Planctomycetales bacterium]
MRTDRLTTGLPALDRALGGGLLPGSLTMIVGATGIGKTQLGLHFLHAGLEAGEPSTAIIDLSSRGDSQNHQGYCSDLFERQLSVASLDELLESHFSSASYSPETLPHTVLKFLGYSGHRVLRSQLDVDQWHAWQSELNRRMPVLFRFVYQHLMHGTRRFVVDGIEPIDDPSESLQLDLLELIYHRMLRQEHDWLAREVLREKYRENEHLVQQHAYDHRQSAAVVLVTTKQSMLEQLIAEPLADGDLAAGANTVLLLGRRFQKSEMQRGLYVAKHRGSFADSRIIDFAITDRGLQIAD